MRQTSHKKKDTKQFFLSLRKIFADVRRQKGIELRFFFVNRGLCEIPRFFFPQLYGYLVVFLNVAVVVFKICCLRLNFSVRLLMLVLLVQCDVATLNGVVNMAGRREYVKHLLNGELARG